MKIRIPRPAPPHRIPVRGRFRATSSPSVETKPAPEPADPKKLVERADCFGHHLSRLTPSPQFVIQRVRNGCLEPKDFKKLREMESPEDIEEFFRDNKVSNFSQKVYRNQRKDLFGSLGASTTTTTHTPETLKSLKRSGSLPEEEEPELKIPRSEQEDINLPEVKDFEKLEGMKSIEDVHPLPPTSKPFKPPSRKSGLSWPKRGTTTTTTTTTHTPEAFKSLKRSGSLPEEEEPELKIPRSEQEDINLPEVKDFEKLEGMKSIDDVHPLPPTSKPFKPPSRKSGLSWPKRGTTTTTTTTTHTPEAPKPLKRSGGSLPKEEKLGRIEELLNTPLSKRIEDALSAQKIIDNDKDYRKKYSKTSTLKNQAFKALAGNADEIFLSGHRERSTTSQNSREKAEMGYGTPNIKAVQELAKKIGFESLDKDILSHAEKQFATAHPNKPFANSQSMCKGRGGKTKGECQEFFTLLANHPEHLTQVASEPERIRVFLPGGRQRELDPGAKDFDEKVKIVEEEERKLLENWEEPEDIEKKSKKEEKKEDKDEEESSD